MAVAVLAVVALPRHTSPDREDRPAVRVEALVPPPAPVPPAAARATSPADVPDVVPLRPVRDVQKKPPPPREMKTAVAEPTAPGPATAPAAAPPPGEISHAKAETAESGPPTPAEAIPASNAVGPAPVTITGCVEISVDEDRFRLTDTEGDDAPRSRSWRTGFLKKRSAPLALVEPPDPLALRRLVGHRVSATGVLANRELHVRSLRVVAASCD